MLLVVCRLLLGITNTGTNTVADDAIADAVSDSVTNLRADATNTGADVLRLRMRTYTWQLLCVWKCHHALAAHRPVQQT